jgi:formate--tetrahydrofolate ligase
MIDNHIHHGNELDINVKNVTIRRCMDTNDRQLRNIVCGLGRSVDGVPREDGFDITAASEVMAILCMATDLADLKARLDRITIGYNKAGGPVCAGDLKAGGAMAVLLKDAIMPNLVQTLEHTPVFMHGGPFANIAHGCNSIVATKMAMRLADHTVTEAGFGADLGAEKFLDIKCRNADIWPNAVVMVATLRALKHHGGAPGDKLADPDAEALQKGFANMDRHIDNLKNKFGLNVVVAINRFAADPRDEIDLVKSHAESRGAACAVCDAWARGGEGALELAKAVADNMSDHLLPSHPYDYAQPIRAKVRELAWKIYDADTVDFDSGAIKKIDWYEKQGHTNLPVCIAKTQYSFSDDPGKLGAPKEYRISVRDVKLCSGAGFIVVLCGDIMRMPGLPKKPAAMNITIDAAGEIEGLF